MKLRITAASDFHGNHDVLEHVRQMAVRHKSELLLLPGDICGFSHYPPADWAFLEDLQRVAQQIRIILTPGNHDYWNPDGDMFFRPCQESQDISDIPLGTIVCLIDQSVRYKGFNIYGSPHTSEYNGWNWQKPVADLCFDIPADTNIIISHSPAFGMGDFAFGKRIGSEALADAVKELRYLRVHAFGHNHGDFGWRFGTDPLFANVSCLDDNYRPALHGVLHHVLTD